jgi:two-component system, OmpR family, response regulator
LSDSANILAIDDDPSVLKTITDYLGDNEMRVTALPSDRGVAVLMAKEMIDLRVLDRHLPGVV